MNAILLLGLGVVLIGGGFWGRMAGRPPYDSLLSWCAPIGLMVTLTGIILLLIPDFFQ